MPAPDHHLAVDRTRPLVNDPVNGHNRWHPSILPALEIEPGETVRLDLRDGFDVQLNPDSTADDVSALDLNRGHPLTGPISIRGAQPGDLVDIEVLDVTPADWGYTLVMPHGGVLGYRFSEPFFVKWELRDGIARSDQLPGLAIRGDPFLGVVGLAPSLEQVQLFASRERALGDGGSHALPPTHEGLFRAAAPLRPTG
jgi:formamidase